ncbi:MAG: GNAT family N-acetyltransferase [Pseudomonadales bacterium]|jgi:hypothetical protein|nr:GNAT family N-acetyltransferase [Pseudomonadales bacterium]
MQVWQRFKQARAEYGTLNLLLFALQRSIQRIAPTALFERLYVMRQPVASAASAPSRRGAAIDVIAPPPDDPRLTLITRLPGELAARFAQRAVCLCAVRQDELLGWLWFAEHRFKEFDYPLEFHLPPNSAWDFDVYVMPRARLGAAFPRLWDTAATRMRARGITHSFSIVSAFNPMSRTSHERLGATSLGSLMIIRLGSFQAVLTRRFGMPLRCSLRRDFRASVRLRTDR